MSDTYSKTIPYYGTPMWGSFLDVWTGKTIPTDVTDLRYEIDPQYDLRPDLLANALYQDSKLWWVFSIRNPDILLDPLMSFRTGIIIYIPTKAVIQAAIGM